MTKVSSANSKNDESRDSITIDDETFYVGDCILVKGDGVQQPFIGRIRSFTNKHRDLSHLKVNVYWFYRPEECKAGRRQFHGAKELFKSNHADVISADTILQKCEVHTLSKYRDLDEEGDADFYSRFSYDPGEDKFGPEVVPVYCLCELPYNPDTYMIMCGECQDWFHPRCIGISDSQVKKYSSQQFFCPKCSKERGQLSHRDKKMKV